MPQHVIFYAFVALAGLFWLLAFRYGSARKTLRPLLGFTLGGIAVWIWQVSEPSVIFSDFTTAYYPAGRAILEDIPHLFTRCRDSPVCGFVNIPIVAFLFTPFSILTLRHAQWLFAGLSLIGLLMSLGLLWSITEQRPARKWAILLLFAINGPLFYSLKEGNLTHFALLLLIAGVVCLDKTWDRSAGVCFALAGIIKLPLLLFALYFIGKRRWATVVGYSATVVTVTALSFWYAGWDGHVEWYREVIMPFSNKGLTAFNVQSMEGFLLRLQGDAKLYDWKPMEVAGEVKMAAQACAALLVGLSCIFFLRDPGKQVRETIFLELSMVLCLALIISPISWTHYYLFLLLPLALYAGNRLPIADHRGWLVAMITCLLLISPPVMFMGQHDEEYGQIARLFLSHYLVGALMLWGMLAYARWRVADVQSLRLVEADPKAFTSQDVEQTEDFDVSDESDRKVAG
ncbi:MAG: rane protein of unknown function [Nitrospira sp.]|jgi:hypothetical protein|nr:rane protein of unknown function [Nitrospira sp.]